MKPVLLLVLAALGLILVQAVLWPWLVPLVVKPDLVLLLTVYLALTSSPNRGAVAVFLLGSWYDTLAGSHPGLHGVVLLLVFWVVRYFSRRMNTESSFFIISMSLLATLLQALLIICFGSFAGAGRLWPVIFAELPLQLIFNFFSGLIFLLLVSRIGLSLQIYVPRDEELV